MGSCESQERQFLEWVLHRGVSAVVQPQWQVPLMGRWWEPGFCTPRHLQPAARRFGGHCCSTKCLHPIRRFSVTDSQTGGMNRFSFKTTPLCVFMPGTSIPPLFQLDANGCGWHNASKAEDRKKSRVTCLKVFKYRQNWKNRATADGWISTRMTQLC